MAKADVREVDLDLVNVSLRDLLKKDSDIALHKAIRRVINDAEDEAPSSVSAFNSAV